MANIQAKDANGNDVPVYEARFNNLGQVESLFIKNGNHMQWVHARDYDVTVTEGVEQELPPQPEIMTKDTQLKGNVVRNKTADEEAEAADNANDLTAAEQPAPKPKRVRRERKQQELSELETVAPGGDFEPILDDSLVPDEPVPAEQTKPLDDDGVLGKDDLNPPAK